jgi:hypothetical protein
MALEANNTIVSIWNSCIHIDRLYTLQYQYVIKASVGRERVKSRVNGGIGSKFKNTPGNTRQERERERYG